MSQIPSLKSHLATTIWRQGGIAMARLAGWATMPVCALAGSALPLLAVSVQAQGLQAPVFQASVSQAERAPMADGQREDAHAMLNSALIRLNRNPHDAE